MGIPVAKKKECPDLPFHREGRAAPRGDLATWIASPPAKRATRNDKLGPYQKNTKAVLRGLGVRALRGLWLVQSTTGDHDRDHPGRYCRGGHRVGHPGDRRAGRPGNG